MAGIAAEAVNFGVCEGGVADEQALVQFLTSISPPWNILKIQGQARWAVLQSILLIREHRAAYDALVEGLTEGKGIGDLIFEIEKHLPKELPSTVRAKERAEKKKSSEIDLLMRFVQNRTWRVGGIQKDDPNKAAAVAESTASVDEEPFQNMNQDSVKEFARRMQYLQQAVKSGDIDLSVADSKEGGVWLNGLRSMKPSSTSNTTTQIVGDISTLDSTMIPAFQQEIQIPPPKSGYEEAVKELAIKEGLIDPETGLPKDSTESVTPTENVEQPWTIDRMLSEHRGFQFKEIELEEISQMRKVSLRCSLLHYFIVCVY